MEFLSPLALLMLLAVPLLIGGIVLYSRKNNSRHSHFQQITTSKNHLKSRAIVSQLCLVLAFTSGIIACARPYIGKETVTINTPKNGLLILIDSSTSMLAEDVKPSRAELARVRANELINALPNHEIGLASFSENFNLISPYSEDHESISKSLSICYPDINYPVGSNIGRAVHTALSTLSKLKQSSHSIVLFSDGEENKYNIDKALKLASKAKIPIYTVGLGTTAGSTIPDNSRRDNKFRDFRNNLVYSKLSPDSLKSFSYQSKALYTTSSKDGMKALIKAIKSHAKSGQLTSNIDIPNEVYMWFLAISILFMISSVFCNVLIKVPRYSTYQSLLLICLCISSAQAEEGIVSKAKTKFFDEARHYKKGRQLMQEKKYPSAITELKLASLSAEGDKKAEIHFSIAESYSQIQKFEQAIKQFSKALLHSDQTKQSEASYNLANSLFSNTWQHLKPIDSKIDFAEHIKHGLSLYKQDPNIESPINPKTIAIAIREWKDAIEYYNYSLQLSSQHSNAQQNLKTVTILLKQLEEIANPETNTNKENPPSKKPPEEPNEDKKDKEGEKEDEEGEVKPDGDKPSDKKGNRPDESDHINDQNKEQNNEKKNSQDKTPEDKTPEDKTPEDKTPEDKTPEDKTPEDIPTQTQEKPKLTEEEKAYLELESLSDSQLSPFKRTIRSSRRSDYDW